MPPLDEHQLEQAAAHEQRTRDASVAAVRQRPREAQVFDDAGRVVCRGCDEPLDAARLDALPSATRCVDCQDRHERWGR